ncbi:MAG: FmdB family zinc ribbon protein [Armatimonadota bacterium]|nr:zinc ribbon domain-containing protein [bacterium]
MPTYAYRCKKCEHQFETIQKMTDEPLKECPKCKGEIARILFPVGIVFKGSGFHVNDYPSRAKSSTSAPATKEDSKPSKETATAAKS